MEKITCKISWSGDNWCATNGEEVEGCIVSTGNTIDKVKEEFKSDLAFHIEGMVADGDAVPQWMAAGEYELAYELEISALLRQSQEYTTLAAISRATGINQRQLGHYAAGRSNPRPEQRRKIIEGLHEIGRQCLAVV